MNNTLQLKETIPHILPTDFIIHKQLYAIVVGGNTVVQLAIFKTEQCHVCGKVGHISRVCCNRQQNASRERGHTANIVDDQITQTNTSSQNTEYTLFPIKSPTATPSWRTVLTINGTQVEMEIDTGASVSLISKGTFDK